jgi:hypothetical protein
MDRTVRELTLIAVVALLCLMLSWAFKADLFAIFFAAAGFNQCSAISRSFALAGRARASRIRFSNSGAMGGLPSFLPR